MRVRTCSQRSPVTSPVLAAEEPEFSQRRGLSRRENAVLVLRPGREARINMACKPFRHAGIPAKSASGRWLDMDRPVFHSFFHSCGKLAGTPQPRDGVHVSALDDARGRTTLTHRPAATPRDRQFRPKRPARASAQARTLSLTRSEQHGYYCRFTMVVGPLQRAVANT